MESKVEKRNLLHVVKSNNLMELFPLLLNKKEEECKISPSEFIKEITLSAEERHKKLIHMSMMQPKEATECRTGISVTPKIIIFQSFEIRKTYTLQIQVRNNGKALLPLKMICPQSTYFSARFIGTPITRVAPGLSAEYEVIFTPRDMKDYSHVLNFKTDKEMLSVPIIAIGPRPLLDIPDEITVDPAPVKIAKSKIVIVRNIGMISADFNFVTKGFFKVKPAKGTIGVQELLQVSVIFESPVTGSYTETLYLHLETGEKLSIMLHGSAENISVRLDKNIIVHDDTFVGLKRSKVFHIQNNSQSLIKFSWKRNKSLKDDLNVIDKMRDKYEVLKDLEVLKGAKQDYFNLCSHKTHELAWERILSDELRLLQREEFQFQHPAFKIVPENGELFPRTQAKMLAVFEPTSCGLENANAYLEVSGRDERLTLQMKGNGLGPLIVLSVEVLDIDFIFLCSVHTYEVIAVNKGDIPGTIVFKQEPLVFGGKVEVLPNMRYLKPSEHIALKISFTSNRHGDFTEKLNFIVAESGEKVCLVFKGKIVSPTLHFEKTLIDFGTIPVGFPVSKEVTLSNLSMVPVTFSLKILSEGNQPSMSYEKYSKLTVKPQLPKFPREFNIDPVEGVVEPYSSRTVTLTLTANIARKWSTQLMVDMWDSETESVSCPIRFYSQIATVAVEPSTIVIPFCFINYPYTRLVTLENTSNISAFFYIIPQNPHEQKTMTYSANISQGVIQPKGTAKVSLTIMTTALGRQTMPLNILIFGNDTPMDVCQICCVGQGPVVTIKPNSLEWGEVPLLQETTKYLTITNESPIPASFTITMAKPDSPWVVSPSHSVLASEEKITINISLLLRDRGKYHDALKIQINNGKTLTCSTSVIGTGNSLLMQPNINGKYDLGTLFSHRKYTFEILLKNEGTKLIGIIWCPLQDIKAFASLKFISPPDLVFKMDPAKVELPGGCSKVVNLEVYSAYSGSYSQFFYCYANAELFIKDLYMTTEVTAEFVEPLVQFDRTELHFYYNISSSGIEEKFTDFVNVKNISVLPLCVTAVVNPPFYIKGNSGQEIYKEELDIPGKEGKKVTVGFKASEDPNRRCHIYKDKLSITFREHLKKTSIALIGEVNYPNVIILPRSVNFGCIPVAASAYREFIIVNVSPVTVNYTIKWEEKVSSIIYIEQSETSNSFRKLSDEICCETNNKSSINNDEEPREVTPEKSEHSENITPENNKNPDGKLEDLGLVPPKKPTLKIPEITIKESDIKNVMFPLIQKYYVRDEMITNVYKTIRSSASENTPEKPAFMQFFDITPFYGRLEKYQTQVVSICFEPNAAMKAHVQARLDIECGPVEIITINAKAADLDYLLNKIHIDFGRQFFWDISSEYLKIKNTSFLEFDFEANTVDQNEIEVDGDSPIEAGVLIITPRTGFVPAMTEKSIRVQYHPGLPGKFEEKFQLRIGYLDPITILVSGFAVFPQVHFDLPRSEMSSIPVEIGYAAIASITPDWLTTQVHYQSPSISTTITSERISENVRKDDIIEKDETTEKWTTINRNDCVLTQIDIDLAIERVLAFKVLSTANSRKVPLVFARSIPNFLVPPYEIDFGIVTIGRSVEETFSVTNYGPLSAVLFFSPDKDHKNRVMQVKVRTRNEVRVGGTVQIAIHFDPKRSRFTEQYEKIDYTFYFEVYQGARIPVRATAIVTYPFVTPSVKSLNFNEVTCGHCKVMCMKLKNFGWVPASWSISFRLTPREMTVMHQSGILDGRFMFLLGTNKGVLFPNESFLLQITFKPQFGGKFGATMIIKVEGGFDDHKVLLSGESIEPRLKISETTIAFEPTLPYPRKLIKYFTVQNASAFPIEFYLPEFDQQVKEEEKVLRALMLYYQTNELLLPARNPGDKLPPELVDFYTLLLDNLNAKYLERKREKLFHPSGSPSSIFEFDDGQDSTEKKKKIKRGSSSYRPRSSLIIHSHVNLPDSVQEVSLFKEKTAEEIQDMLHDYIRGCSSIEGRYDPLKSILDSVQIPRKTEALEPIQGTIIILHTAPRTNPVHIMKLFERTLKKPVFNVDGIVMEETALVRCPAAIVLRSIIEQTYADHMDSKTLNKVEESTSQVFNKKQAKETPLEDIFEDLEKKIDQLFILRDESTITSGYLEDLTSSIGSSKKEKEKIQTPNVKWGPQTGGILLGLDNLVFEVLRFRLQMEAVTGVLIENLNSRWINNPVGVLKLLIKASGNISNIFVICLMCSFDKYKEFVMQKEANEEKILSNIKEEALKVLEDGEEELSALPLNSEDIKEIYARYITNRREDYKKFLKVTEERAQQRKIKKLPSKKTLLSPANTSPKVHQSGSQKEKMLFESNSKETEKSKDKEKATRSGINTRVKSVKKEEEEEEELLFINFEEQLMEIRNFLEFWDRQSGMSVEVHSAAKNKKNTSPKKVYSTPEVESARETSKDVGIPLWLIDENNLESPLVEFICELLKQILINRRISFDSENWAINVPPSVTYSVVSYPPNRHPMNVLDVFNLCSTDRNPSISLPEDENILKTIPEDKILKVDSDSSLKAGKRNSDMVKSKVESRMSTASKYSRPKKSIGSYVGENQPLKSRWILQESESTIWCAQFLPTKPGVFEQSYTVNLVTEPINNNYIIKCTGICDIPRLDMNPENIFSSIAPEKPQDYIYSPTFFYSNYCFDFGSVIPNQLKDDGHNRELHAIFSLTNISALPVELLVMFADDALRETPIGSPHFDMSPKKAFLKPYQTFLLNVYANPSKYGSTQEELMLFVKGNPKIETIKIKCYGVRVSVNIEPKFIDFDRMLLYRRAKRAITFTNSNLIPLFIALSGYNKLPPQFKFSATKSWVQPLMSFTIEIEYQASEVQVISEEIIQVLVYDRVEAVDPVQTLSFPVSAEAYDASVDIFFASKEDYHVDFEEIRIQNEYTKSVTLKNNGKYILGYKIDIDYDLLEENGDEEFFLSPEEGKLPVGKAVPLTVHIQARTEVNWKRLPLFRITLTEPYNNNELVASIPIEVSAKSFFSRCVIQPLSELNIGPVLIGSQKIVTLSIENKGQFSFVYSIEPALVDLPSDLEMDLIKKSTKRPSEASSKEKIKKIPGGSLKVGCFEITPSSGTVDVKQTVVVNVHFCPAEIQQYEEVVVIKVSESPPHQKDGNELRLFAEGCIPELNLDDFESIFREHQVKRSGNDIPHLPDIGYQTIFNVDAKQLCFKNVCLGKTVEARIHLENKGQIDCHVMSSINKPDAKRSRSLIESGSDSFSIKPEELIISPYASGTFTISFTPEMLQAYRSQIMLSLLKPEKYISPPTIFNIFASVCSPEVEIIEPFLRSPDGQGLVFFNPTTPGRTSNSHISFKNVGKIESKVILEIYQSEQDIFMVEPKPYTETMLKAWELNKSINHTVLVTIQPGETAEFNVFFKPLEIKNYSAEIKLLIIDNGFKNLSYKLSGEAFLEEIILEKIQTKMPFAEENHLDSSSCRQTVPGQYCLNLGHCFINKKKKFLARLSNKTNKDYFKFEWGDIPPSLTVQPPVGHLYPGTYKEIIFIFLPQDNLEMEEVPLTCSLKKIQYPVQPEGPSWDTRLIHYRSGLVNETDSNIPKIGSSSQQESTRNEVQVSGQEPNYEVIPDSDSELIIFFSAVADYARLFCETTVINFADTFMFQNRCFPLALENKGNVAFDYTLELISVTYKPLKVDRALQVNPLSITKLRPNSGAEPKSALAKRKIMKKKTDILDTSKPRPLDNESLLDLFPDHNEENNFQDLASEKQIEPYNPIHLENFTGTIMPKEKAFCQINFSPLDVYEYKGIIKIKVDNIHPDQILPEIEINARSIMPYCHFDLPESDYIQNGRRDYSRPGPVGSFSGVPLDPQVKAVEVKILGIKVVKPIHFHAINPTDSDYSFSWVNVTQNQPGAVQSLHCTYLDGTIQAGRQKLMEFVFVSQTPGTFEYFWKFWIPRHQIEMIFLFVIIVQEPVMYFLKNHLIMRPTSVGATVSDVVTLVNEDDVSSDFYFVPNSLYSDGRVNALKVQPLSGTINPKSEVNLRISFVGKKAGNVLFHLKCKIKKLQNPLKLIVDTTTHAVEPLITFEDLSGSKHVADPSMNNVIDFGKELHTERTEKIRLFLTSTSKLSFFYEWVYDKRELMKHNCSLSFSKAEGHVLSFSREECDLNIIFSKKSILTSFPIKLKIARGPTYNFLVSASAISPAYEFSFLSYDFGYCYLQNTEYPFYEKNLIFKNKDKNELLLESSSENLKNFTFILEKSRIGPGKELSIPIRFYPKEAVRYEEEISFVISGLFQKVISIFGHGIEFKVTLANVADANIYLGATRVGCKQSKAFSVVNKGLAPATILVGFADQLPVNLSCLARPEENHSELCPEHRLAKTLTLSPSRPITLRPKEICAFKVEYTPHQRTSSFTETVCMQFQERVDPLCVITGSSVGPKFSLDKKYLAFGAVIANYSSTLKLKIANSGDIGARFKWETENLDDFSIYPETGYLSSESDFLVEVSFHPKSIRHCIKNTVECKLFISDTETYPSLFLKLSGDCVDLPQPQKSVFFKCDVRNNDIKTVEINNRTGTDWRLVPIFGGEYFSGLDLIFVPSISSAEYEITYTPLKMTQENSSHKGSLFFCLPDGTGQLYDLIGTALPPPPCETIEREVPCKTKYTELLKVTNWLRSHQRFTVTRTYLDNENSDDLVFTCSGSDVFELAPSAEKEYKLNFYAYKFGKLHFNVHFTNEETKEYIWFDITFNVVMCGPLEIITLKSRVRQTCFYGLKLENPLKEPVQYKIDCSNPEVLIPAVDVLQSGSTAIVDIGFRPLHVYEKTEQLKASCPELGIFPMELRLAASEAPPEECTTFEAPLGSNDSKSVCVRNYHNSQAILNCRTDSDEFKIEERFLVSGQDSISIEIIYEPFSIGQSVANLYIDSENAGNFIFPLVGNSSKPLAKGPYVMKSGTSLSVPFKNVLREVKSFQVYVDNPAFSVKPSLDEIPSGSEIKILVSLQKIRDAEKLMRDTGSNFRYPVMGQLVVECFNPHIKWQYYLKGVA